MKQVEILCAACCVAGLDGEICERERPLLEQMAHEAGVGPVSLEAMIERATDEPNYYQEQLCIARSDPDTILTTLFRIAMADHELALEERVILQHFADKLGMSRQRFDQISAAAVKQFEQDSDSPP